MEKLQYVVYQEGKSTEPELIEVFSSKSLIVAKEMLKGIKNNYARISLVRKVYNPPPRGKVYKKEEHGWRNEILEVIAEN